MNTQKWTIAYAHHLILMLVLFSAGIGIAAAADPIISITPSQSTVQVGDDFDVYIQVNPNENTLQMAKVSLTFDPSLASLTVANGGMFNTFFSAGTQRGGMVANICGAADPGVSTTGNLAVLHLHACRAGTFTLELSDETTVTVTEALTPTINNGTVTIDVRGAPISTTRDISDQRVEPESIFTVTLTVTANEDDVQAPALKENLPAGWVVTEGDSGDAVYDPVTTEWIWVARMSSGETKTVTYNVTIPADAVSQDYHISGHASAYGVDPIEIGGESRVTVVTLCGDVNHDELLSIADVTLALQMAANNTDIDFAADVNADGAVTSVDALMIWQSMLS